MIGLAALFFGTALLYSSVGFGGGSTYTALLVLGGVDYRAVPAISLVCNILVVANCLIRRRPSAPSAGAHDIVELLTIDGARRNAIEGEALFGMREARVERVRPEKPREHLHRIPFEGEA